MSDNLEEFITQGQIAGLPKEKNHPFSNERTERTEQSSPVLPTPLDNPEHMHPVQKEKESQIGSKRFDLNSHSGRYAPIFREK